MLTAVLGETTSTKFYWCGGEGIWDTIYNFHLLKTEASFSKCQLVPLRMIPPASIMLLYRSQKLLSRATNSQASGNAHLRQAPFSSLWLPSPLHSCIMASPSASARTHFKLWMGWLDGLKDASTPIQHLDGLECRDNAQPVHFLVGTAGIR